MDAITLLVEDHRRLNRLFDPVVAGDRGTIPAACDALLMHSRMEEEVLYPGIARLVPDDDWDVDATVRGHLRMRRLILQLVQSSPATNEYVDAASELAQLVKQHVTEQEDTLFPRIGKLLGPGESEDMAMALQHVRDASSGGASSDGDTSWTQDPVTQDPTVDRSVDAVIRRTEGV